MKPGLERWKSDWAENASVSMGIALLVNLARRELAQQPSTSKGA